MTFRYLLIKVLIGVMIAGCGVEQVSTPLPQPVPQPQRFFIRRSTPDHQHQATLIVGLAQAVAGAGEVHLRDRISGLNITPLSNAAGSFSGVLAVGEGAEIELWFETAHGQSLPILLSAANPTYGPALDETDVNGPSVVSPPDAQGLVTVTNGADPESRLVMATPNSEILVSNASNSEVLVSTTDASGGFEVRLPGAVGDVIHLLLADPAASEQTSDFLSFMVPQF